MSDAGRRTVRAALVAAFLAAAACENSPVGKPSSSAAAVSPPPPGAPASPAPAATPAAIALADVPVEAERFDELRRNVAADLAEAPGADVDAAIARIERRAPRLLMTPALASKEEVQLVELQDLDVEIRNLDEEATRLEAGLAGRAHTLENDLANITAARDRWTATLPQLAAREAPEPLRLRAEATVGSIGTLLRDLKGALDQTLMRLDRVSRARSTLAAGRLEVSEKRRSAQRQLFASSEGPIWRFAAPRRPMAEFAAQRLSRDSRRFASWASERGGHAALSFLALFAAAFAVFLLLRAPAREAAKADPEARAAVPVFERPVAAAILAALVGMIGIVPRPQAPVLVWDIVWLLSILSTAILLRKLIAPPLRRTLYVVTAAACLYPLRYLYEQDPLLERLVLMAQAGAVAATLARDVFSGRWRPVFAGNARRRFGMVAMAVSVVLLGVAFGLAIVGYVAPARLLRTGVIGSLGFGLIAIGFYSLAYGLASALLATRAAQGSRLVGSHSAGIRKILRRVLGALSYFQWAVWSLAAFGALDSVSRSVSWLLASTIAIGSARLPVSGFLTFVLVLGAAFLLASLVRFVLEVEVLPRLHLSRGLPFTISTTVRYLIVAAGILLAFSAAGISLSRVTLLAGALGVGIGFGLQNIVSNFVAGLILLFERPIQAGDIVDVGTLVGEVTRIGMRSSTVRTAEGAEVIVPNSDLISKSFINWTLSDRRRRLEIRVGVAYGTDPERVIALLLQAARDHPEAMTEPAPAAYFVGFGDSSLDFLLHVWVSRFEQTLALQSAIRRAVHRLLGENGIEIPFPQRDLNLRVVSPAAAETLRGEPAAPPADEPGDTDAPRT